MFNTASSKTHHIVLLQAIRIDTGMFFKIPTLDHTSRIPLGIQVHIQRPLDLDMLDAEILDKNNHQLIAEIRREKAGGLRREAAESLPLHTIMHMPCC